MGKEKKRRKRLIALPSSLPLKVHASAHAQRSSQCRQHRHYDLNHRLPKFLVRISLISLIFGLRPTCFFQTEIIRNYSEINSFNSFNSFNSWSF